jgi:hypothetical protein
MMVQRGGLELLSLPFKVAARFRLRMLIASPDRRIYGIKKRADPKTSP